MALNQTGLMDEDGEYADWIEIYNPTAGNVNLEGWSLTDDAEIPKKWIFPEINIPANGYIVVFASGKNKLNTAGKLHTNFKLSGTGEYLALYNGSETVISEFSPAFPEQFTDKSYGYYIGTYLYFASPTPLSSNSLSGEKIMPPPVFSIKHGFFASPFNLSISTGVSTAKIYYTTDGSEPSDENGNLYSTPVAISKTTVIRAIAQETDGSKSIINTQTYLFTSDIIHQSNAPDGYPAEWGPYTQIAGNAIADYEMDPELVANATFANSLQNALKDLPVVSLVTDKNNFFSHEENEQTGGIYIYTGTPVGNDIGRGWERPVSLEIFDKDTLSVQVNCGVKLNGGHSRLPEKTPKHSFRLQFKSEYGVSTFDYPIFGKNAANSFNVLILKAGFGNSWVHHASDERNRAQLQRDGWTKDSQGEMGHVYGHTIYAHLYLNGLYWGIYEISERMDKDFASSYLEGDPEDFDVIKDYAEVADGNLDAWTDLINKVNGGIDTHDDFMEIQGKNPDGTKNPNLNAMVDVENLIDYMLINFYGGNTDWDHHNWAAIRNRVDPGDGFIFMCWDSEHMVKTTGTNVLNENNANCPSNIFQQLTLHSEFKRLVADRAQKHLNSEGVLTPDKNIARWNKRSDIIEDVVIAESARWGDYRRDVHPYQTSGPFDLYTKEDHWLPQREFMINTYFPQRTAVFINQLRDGGLFPLVNAPELKLNNANVSSARVKLNDKVTLSAPQGTIYYTSNGTDPVVWNDASESSSTDLIIESSAKKVFVPVANIGTTWLSDLSFNDASWGNCTGSPGGIGYENGSGYEGFISYDVKNLMFNGASPNPSCYVRIKFTVDGDKLSSYNDLKLYMNYDDGFVAYINGTKVAEFNAPASPSWNSASSGSKEGGTAEAFNISAFLSLLKAGENLLAIQGLNQNTTSSDFLILPSLVASNVASGGSISAEAKQYTGEINIENSLWINARVFYNNEWSALTSGAFMIPADFQNLKITEVHYHPTKKDSIDDGKFEFIEIKNTGNSPIDLSSLQFVDGIDYVFKDGVIINPGEFIVLASEDIHFYSRYGFMPFDEYGGQLNNDGEWLKLMEPVNKDTIISFRYNDGGNWPALADGYGNSIVPVDPNPINDQTLPEYWRASFAAGGSPGKDDLDPATNTDEILPLISGTVLSQNYPNPFSQFTYIDYQLDQTYQVHLSVYNMMGQKLTTLVNELQGSGLYQVELNAQKFNLQGINQGVLYYRLEISNNVKSEVKTGKMIFIRP